MTSTEYSLSSQHSFASLIETTSSLEPTPLLRLISFAIRKSGSDTRPLSANSDDIAILLDHNNVPTRLIDLPTNLTSSEYPTLIINSRDDGRYFVVYRENSKTYIYCPYTNTISFLVNGYNFSDKAFEVYPSLPHHLSNSLEIAGFSLRGLWTSVAMLLTASLLLMIFNLLVPVMNNFLVEKVLPESDYRILAEGLIIGLIVVFFTATVQYLQSIQMLRIETIADLKLQTALMERLLKLPISFFNTFSTADLSSRVMAISQLRQVLSSGIFTTFISAFFAAAYFVLMYNYSVYLAFWATGLTALSLIYISWLAYNSAVINLPIAEFSADLSNSTLQALLGIVQLKTSGAERNFLKSWSLQLRKLINLQLKQLIYSDLFSAYNDLIVPLGTLLIFVLVVPTVLSGQNSTLSWIIVYISFNSAFSGFNRILTASMTMFISVSGQAYVLWQRARPIMFQNPEPGYSPSAIYYDVQGGISISSLTFTYPGLTKPTLDNISIEIKPGQHVAITGDSGCGKSTLVRLILGFFEAEQGSIHIDNILLQKLAIRYYRKQIGVVMQDSPLPNGSISQIVSGGQDFNDDQIWQALKNANVADEIHSMPMKLQTILNQGAFNISGGQRQRIALARALIKNPRILILDEATSALDNDSQTLISNSIENMQITRISIAHRLSTIRNADNIFVLGEGTIISSGKWDAVSPYLVAH